MKRHTRRITCLLLVLGYCGTPLSRGEMNPGNPSPQEKYLPGGRLDYEDYDRLIRYIHHLSLEQEGVTSAVSRLNALVEKELKSAMKALVTTPETKIIYGAYTPPLDASQLSKITDHAQYEPLTGRDGGEGLRIIWQLAYPFSPTDTRMVSMILFYHWDATEHEFRLNDRTESLRIRVQARRFCPEKISKTGSVGLSYRVVFRNSLPSSVRHVVAIVPTESVDDRGDPSSATMSECADPVMCEVCHQNSQNEISKKVRDRPFDQIQSLERVIEHIERMDPAVTRDHIRQLLRQPKVTFLPRGFLDAIDRDLKAIDARAQKLLPVPPE